MPLKRDLPLCMSSKSLKEFSVKLHKTIYGKELRAKDRL
jgi:hypothetical protein